MFQKTLLALIISAFATVASAQGLIRDAEIERSLRQLSKPLLQKAGIAPNSVRIYIVSDNRMNAFVAGGNNIFVHSGLVKRLKSAAQLQAVLAHEIAHLAAGHQTQRSTSFANSKTAAGLGALLGVAAAAAGAPQAGIGLAAGTNSASQRSFFANTRSQETVADKLGTRYMAQAGIDPKAAIEVMNIFRGQELTTARNQDPYVRTHPLNSERIASLKAQTKAYKVAKNINQAASQYWYGRMKAKFNGFTNSPSATLRRVKKNDKSEIATLTRAIAYHRKPDLKKATVEIDRLLKMRPNDPYYWELNGDFLLDNGNAKSAASAYRKAVTLAPKEPLILAGLGRALNAINTPSSNKEALRVLKSSYARDPRNSRMLRELGVAYARAGQKGNASVALAESYAIRRNFKLASVHAKRAQTILAPGTSGYLKAQDILNAAQRLNKRKR